MTTEAYRSATIQENTTGTRPTSTSFAYFVFHEKKNRILLLTFLIGVTAQFIIFKLLYPFPDFISDSYSYIHTNVYKMDVNLWPIGYSKFILLIHQVSHSDTFLVAIQYLILEISLLYFFFTTTYFFRPTKSIKILLFIFLLFNPISLYLSNCVLSDALFASLTIIFLSQFLWILYHRSIGHVLLQAIIIGIAFTIRYTAIYYPLVALTGMLFSSHKTSTKFWGSLLGIALIIPFILYTKQKTKQITGTAQFSVFGGWQIANNALYMYNYIEVDSSKLPSETRELDKLSKNFFKKIPISKNELASLPGTYFIKVPWAILKPYMFVRYEMDDPPSTFRAWGKVSPIYSKYGFYLISHYPFSFAKHYLWLNTQNYFQPHLEKFGTYNLKINTVPPEVQDWFDYPTPDVYAVSTTFQGKLFYIYPLLFMILNIHFMISLAWLFFSRRIKETGTHFRKSLLFITSFLVINFSFSVYATPVVLRYQIVPLIVLFTFCLLIQEIPTNYRKQIKENSI